MLISIKLGKTLTIIAAINMREIWVIVNIASLWHCSIASVILWSMCEILIDDLMIEYPANVDT